MKYVALFVLSLAWASVFVFTKIAVHYVTPMFIVVVRGVLGSLFLISLVSLMPKVSLFLRLSVKKHLLLLLSSLLVGYLWFVIYQPLFESSICHRN